MTPAPAEARTVWDMALTAAAVFAAILGFSNGVAPAACLGFGVGWMLIALLPVLSLIPIGFLAAERALYLPRIGWAIAVVALASAVLSQRAAAVATAVSQY